MRDGAVARCGGAGESEDALLLREFAHRTANALAVASAALRLADAGGGRGALVRDAGARLERLGAVHRLLARPVPPMVDLAGDLTDVCTALHETADGDPGSLAFELEEALVDGLMARRLTLVAAELVANAQRHALGRDGSGRLLVSLCRRGSGLELVVADQNGAKGVAGGSGSGFGGAIVRELVSLSGGCLDVVRGDAGTTVRVSVPRAIPAAVDVA